MRVAVGSTRPSKVDAVKEVWEELSQRMPQRMQKGLDFLCYDVSTEAPRVPLTAEDLMRGAMSRVDHLILQLKREKSEAHFYVGLEGGFSVLDFSGPRKHVFLESWAYVSDGLEGHFGHGSGISVPARIADPVIDRGIELGIVIDRFCRAKGLSPGQGAWELLSQDLLSRKKSFVLALTAAFAPFYNASVYREETGSPVRTKTSPL